MLFVCERAHVWLWSVFRSDTDFHICFNTEIKAKTESASAERSHSESTQRTDSGSYQTERSTKPKRL